MLLKLFKNKIKPNERLLFNLIQPMRQLFAMHSHLICNLLNVVSSKGILRIHALLSSGGSICTRASLPLLIADLESTRSLRLSIKSYLNFAITMENVDQAAIINAFQETY